MAAGERLPERSQDRHGRGPGRRRGRGRAHRGDAGGPGEEGAQHDRDEPAGQAAPEANPAEVGDEHHAQRGESHQRAGEGAQQEPERDEPQRDARQRREERGAGGGPPDPLGEERAGELDETGAEAGDEPGLPGHAGRVGGAGCLRGQLGREHDQEDEGEEGDGVDPEGEGGDVGPSGAPGEPHRLPGVEQVAHQDRDGGAGEDGPVHQVGREPQRVAAERVDDEQLDQVVEGQAEEPVDVTTDEPAQGRTSPGRLRPRGAW